MNSPFPNLLFSFIAGDKWYKTLLWWEFARIPYNLIMGFIGYYSFYVAYVNIPFIYGFIGFILSILFTGGWVLELVKDKKSNISSIAAFRYKYIACIFTVSVIISLGFAIFLWYKA